MEYVLIDQANMVIEFLRNNICLDTAVPPRKTYSHMGATISDAILQAGLNYANIVLPRVRSLAVTYPDFRTTSEFIVLFQTIPLAELINWKSTTKLDRIVDLSWFLHSAKVENEEDLAIWLECEKNVQEIMSISGIGDKTVDYLKMLSGSQAIPIDRHLFKLLELSGVKTSSYNHASTVYTQVANAIGIEKYTLDRNVWGFMSSRRPQTSQLSFFDNCSPL